MDTFLYIHFYFSISIGKVDEAFKIEFKANLKLTSKYEADGKILILPIQGKGDATVNARKYQNYY